jgi:hypothetical protein
MEERIIKEDIVVCIRGGKILKIPFRAECIIPKVEVLENSFDFGNVTTLGNT